MLASIQKITKITPIPNADAIETADVLGWQVVVKKGEFKEGDLVGYIEIDTIAPATEQFEFLRERNFRVRTIKLRGQISQGLVVPLPLTIKKPEEGTDIADLLGIKKFSKEVAIPEVRPKVPKVWYRKWIYLLKYNILYKVFPSLEKKSKKPFPSTEIRKTDEERIQNMQRILETYKGKTFIATEKLDGSSLTAIHEKKGDRICSRNWEFLDDKNEWSTVYASTNYKDYVQKLADFYNTDEVKIQGEYIGKPQGNYYKLEANEIRAFNIFVDGKPLLPADHIEICKKFNIPHCPEIWRGPLNFTLKDILAFAEGKSLLNKNVEREGLVFRCIDDGLSFKVVSNKFLIKNNE